MEHQQASINKIVTNFKQPTMAYQVYAKLDASHILTLAQNTLGWGRGEVKKHISIRKTNITELLCTFLLVTTTSGTQFGL